MWNDLSAYLCGCVDPVDESPRHVHLTREYAAARADATRREAERGASPNSTPASSVRSRSATNAPAAAASGRW